MSLETRFQAAAEKWSHADYSATIEHILTRFHEVHRHQLQTLIPLAEKLEDVHSEHPSCPKGLANALHHAYNDLSSHMMKEEQILFPMIQSGNYMMARMPIQVMELEHDEHEQTIRLLLELTNNLDLPDEACQTWKTLYSGIAEFIEDLQEHIYTENHILFTRVLNQA